MTSEPFGIRMRNEQQDNSPRRRFQEVAAILAEAYLRLMRLRKSSLEELGKFDEKGPQELPQEQLDSFGHRSDE